MPSKVIALRPGSEESIAEQLRTVADQIERGEFGEVLSLSWVADLGGNQVEVGFVGNSPLPGAATHLMLALGMRKLESD